MSANHFRKRRKESGFCSRVSTMATGRGVRSCVPPRSASTGSGGGGTGLATLCDFTLATPTAKFGFTEVRIGFVPALVSAFLALQVGDKRSRDLLLTGRLFGAEEAHQLGLVNEIVEREELEARAHALAKSLIANSPQSISATNRLLARYNRAWLDAAVVAALESNAESRETEDFLEGISAFLEKRKPVWKAR